MCLGVLPDFGTSLTEGTLLHIGNKSSLQSCTVVTKVPYSHALFYIYNEGELHRVSNMRSFADIKYFSTAQYICAYIVHVNTYPGVCFTDCETKKAFQLYCYNSHVV